MYQSDREKLCMLSGGNLTSLLLSLFSPVGGAADGETDGRKAAGRTKDAQLQGQHPQPALVAPRRPAYTVEEQASGQVPGRLD